MRERKEKVGLLIQYLVALADISKNTDVRVFQEIQRAITKIEEELKGMNE